MARTHGRTDPWRSECGPAAFVLAIPPIVQNSPLDGSTGKFRTNFEETAEEFVKALQEALKQLSGLSTAELLATRYERLMSYGRFKEQAVK